MREAVEELLNRYPEATLQDIYKTMYQDRFGVAHILAERDVMSRYIAKEVYSTSGECECYYEPCGWRGEYVRIDLRAVRDGLLSADELAEKLIATAALAEDVSSAEWQQEWASILEVSSDLVTGLENYESDLLLLNECAAQCQTVHHSEAYRVAYSPHYRIVHRSLINK
jgi:hypothetical protein